jgi:phosphohistidine swiveling domain-containing protein
MRKRAHDQLAATQPLNDFTLPEGEYLPLDGELQVGDVTPDHSGSHTLQGVGACGGRVAGRAVVLHDASEAGVLTGEDILVTRQTDPGWAPVFFLVKGLVIERGGMLSHGAIVAREFGIPCVVGVQHATRELFSAGQIEVDGDQGKVHVLETLHKSHSAREAGGSIKPGAQAPGSDHKRQAGARETGDSVKFSVFRPLSRALAFLFGTLTWGLRPRLYAYACYRRLRNRFRLFVQNLSSIKLIYAYWRERYS